MPHRRTWSLVGFCCVLFLLLLSPHALTAGFVVSPRTERNTDISPIFPSASPSVRGVDSTPTPTPFPPVIGRHCGGIGLEPPPPPDWCGCIWGFVYFQDDLEHPVEGVRVEAHFGGNAVSSVTTYGPAETEPYYGLWVDGLGVRGGDTVTLVARYGEYTLTMNVVAEPDEWGEVRVDLIFPHPRPTVTPTPPPPTPAASQPGWQRKRNDLAASKYYRYPSTQRIPDVPFVELWSAPHKNKYLRALTGDVNGDGQLELIQVTGDTLNVYSGDGKLLWSRAIPGVDSLYGSGWLDLSSLGDVTGDGVPEILVTRKTSDTVATLYVYDGFGNLLPSLSRSTVKVARDGAVYVDAVLPPGPNRHAKVVMAAFSNFAANPRGTFLFDYTSGSRLWFYAAGNSVNGSIADVDGDGWLDLLNLSWVAVRNGTSGCGLGWNTCTTDFETWLVLIDENGHEKFSRSLEGGGALSSRIVDLDGDGRREILAVQAHWAEAWHGGISKIYLLDAQGKVLKRLDGPRNLAWTLEAVGDLDRDGRDEAVLGETYNNVDPRLRVYDAELNLIAETVDYDRPQAINDLNGDGIPELIAISSITGRMGVLQLQCRSELNCSLVELWHTELFPSASMVIVSDLTGDGINELIVLAADGVHVLGYRPITPPTPPPTPPPAPPRHTLILVNPTRMANLYGADAVAQLMDRLTALAAHPDVNGTLVRLDEIPAVTAAYAAWDAHSPTADPTHTNEYANAVTEAIKTVIAERFAADPELWYILLVGDDRVIPFRRLDDRSPFGEHTYRHVDPTTTVGAAMAQDRILTDDFYADLVPDSPSNLPLYVPDHPVGRLVETPPQIVAAIDAFLGQSRASVSSILVTGYGLIEDLARKEADILQEGFSLLVRRLIGSDWTTRQFRYQMLHRRRDVHAVNVHATHFAFGAPDGGRITATEVTGAPVDLRGVIAFGPGCQAGLNVPPMATPYPATDFPEAFLARGADYIGNTGWGIGDWGGVSYSEDLAARLAAFLAPGTPTTLGNAWLAAKLDYYLGQKDFDPIDAKVVAQFVLYGFPMYRVGSAGSTQAEVASPSSLLSWPGGTTADRRRLTAAFSTSAVGGQRSAVMSEASQRVTVHYVLSGEAEPWAERRKGVPAPLRKASGTWGTYYSLDGEVGYDPNAPLQPMRRWSLNLSGGRAHGVLFRGGVYTDTLLPDPWISTPTIITGTLPTEGIFTGTTWTPLIPYALKTVPLASGARAEQFIAVFGQYHPRGIERLYRSISFDVYYSESADYTPPTATLTSQRTGNVLRVSVQATDASGIQRVVVTFTASDGHWRTIDLMWNPETERWEGQVPLADALVEYFAQVVDGAGNVAVVTHGEDYFRVFPYDPYEVYLSLVGKE